MERPGWRALLVTVAWGLSTAVFPWGLTAAAERTAAVVNGQAISVADLDRLLEQSGRVGKGVAPPSRDERLEALHLLIDDVLVRQYLRQHGPRIPPAEIERQLSALEAGQKAEGKSLADYLRETGQTLEEVRDNLERMLQLARWVEEQATPERLREYHAANRDLFDRTTVRVSQIVLRLSRDASAAERQRARKRLQELRADLAAGRSDFAALARKHSQCASARQGGDIGFIVRKFQVEEVLARTAFSLPVGGVSDVIETDHGVYLLWVTDRNEGKPTRYEDVADAVRECFELELKQNLVQQLRQRARIDIRLK